MTRKDYNHMPEPEYDYVSLAADYARRIRTGAYPPGIQLPSYSEIAARHNVSEMVVRKAIELLKSQGMVRSVRRRGIFVSDHPNLVRAAPERQMENPEDTFGHESDRDVRIERSNQHVPATEELAEVFGISVGNELLHVVTRATEDGRPVSISDTYQPVGAPDISNASVLEETVADRLPVTSHATWLGTPSGDLVKTVRQRYIGSDERVLMLSDISYPRDRYDAFVFRMTLTEPLKQSPSS
ncbi:MULTISPECIES: GntR family transcriptional regulator [unclassified Nocardia]|uniref:GntR family transcriptional regulator n=1 Tax=unclassified Nocardia TaxID=2637762 RepID=UPI001CE48A41|nr:MULTISPECIES: GntR family transcriptional regulator [unclassified Nocardia]